MINEKSQIILNYFRNGFIGNLITYSSLWPGIINNDLTIF